MKLENGLIHIYTGDGKGKTSASLGLLIRAYGADFKTIFFQFLKGQYTSELKTLDKLNIPYFRTDNVKKFIPYMTEQEKQVCIDDHIKCYEKAKSSILSGDYDVIVLDEIIPAINLDLINLDDVLALLKNKPKHTEIILTGRDPSKKLTEIANYVSFIKSEKHPFDKGIMARLGIEY